ncbi:GNAT family protein [Paenibacillus sp. 19GGS1-52]|uniref:GNAT family N-acetyltransferase n=1 Tax=Paenibacillus sp. 19GGS1-52 TaxID=2758563 RepID=UPI001EFA9A2E|nr:GNAT family protein [Paenibacillus sp. 19GGS1-52]
MNNELGTRIYLRFFVPGDAQERVDVEIRNRAVFEKVSIDRDESYYTLEGQAELIVRWAQEKEAHRRYVFGIFLHETGQLIGDISLVEIMPDTTKKWILGYALDQAHQGHGYMSETIPLVLEFAFQETGIKRIEAGAVPENAASIRVLKKAGFQTVEGSSPHRVKINGKWEEHLLFFIEAGEGQ